MVVSPYGFLRGTAMVMADDVARLPATGINPVVCGDAHLGNFGFYASPEGELVIDLNDFDEAHPGCWEWDLRRLVASIWVAGRENGVIGGPVPGVGPGLCGGVPERGPVLGRPAAADAQLQPPRCRVGCTRQQLRSRCEPKSSAPPSAPARAPVTVRFRASPWSATASGRSSRTRH